MAPSPQRSSEPSQPPLMRPRVGAIMRTKVPTIAPTASLAEAAQQMVDGGDNALFVADSAGQLLGVIGIRHILTAPRKRGLVTADRLAENAKTWATLQVGQVMHRQVVTVSPETRVIEAAAIMTNRGFHPLAVLREGKLAGVISRADIVRSLLAAAVTDASANRGAGPR